MKRIILIFTVLFQFTLHAEQRELTFCGQPVPIHDPNVRQKFFQIVKSQIPTSQLQSLRYNFNKYAWFIDKHLKAYNLPPDLRYLPIVESNFKNSPKSAAGAAGLWQIMPGVAQKLGLMISPEDQRLNPNYSTPAACKLLVEIFNTIKKANGGRGDWALTCAAYNFGSGNVQKMIRAQGNDYYRMNMNSETGKYVYKILAIKELFEHPEDYTGKQYYGENIFATAPKLAERTTNNNAKKYQVKDDDGNEVDVEPMIEKRDPNGFNLPYDETIFEIEAVSLDLSANVVKKNSDSETTHFSTNDEENNEIKVVIKNLSIKNNDGDLIEVQFLNNFGCEGFHVKKNASVKLPVSEDDVRFYFNICNFSIFFLKELGIPKIRLDKEMELRAVLKHD